MARRCAFPVLALGPVLTAAVWLGLPSTPLHSQTPDQSPPAAAQLAQRLQKRYATIRDFRADFTQEVRGGVLRTISTTEHGQMKVKKPGRLLMTYDPPQKKVFVSDGDVIKQYFAADRSGIQSPMPSRDELSTAILFLAGQGNLVNDFHAAMADTQPESEWALALTPVERQEDFALLTLFVDRQSLAFRGMTTLDHQGGTSVFRFDNLKENVGLPDSDFRFTFPKGTNVIYSGGAPHVH